MVFNFLGLLTPNRMENFCTNIKMTCGGTFDASHLGYVYTLLAVE